MIEYEMREKVLKSRKRTKRKLLIDFRDEKYGPLAVFLETEVKNFAAEITEALAEKLGIRGNLCRADFGPETVHITCAAGSMEEEESCSVSRADFEAVLTDYETRLAALRAGQETN